MHPRGGSDFANTETVSGGEREREGGRERNKERERGTVRKRARARGCKNESDTEKEG